MSASYLHNPEKDYSWREAVGGAAVGSAVAATATTGVYVHNAMKPISALRRGVNEAIKESSKQTMARMDAVPQPAMTDSGMSGFLDKMHKAIDSGNLDQADQFHQKATEALSKASEANNAASSQYMQTLGNISKQGKQATETLIKENDAKVAELMTNDSLISRMNLTGNQKLLVGALALGGVAVGAMGIHAMRKHHDRPRPTIDSQLSELDGRIMQGRVTSHVLGA